MIVKHVKTLILMMGILMLAQPTSGQEPMGWEAFQELRKEAQQLQRDKRLDDARELHKRLNAAVLIMLDDPALSLDRKVTAGLIVADALINDGEYDSVLALLERLRALPDITAAGLAKIQCAFGDMANSQGFQSKAADLYEEALALPDLSAGDRFFVLGKMATYCWRSVRDPEQLRPVVERMLALNDPSLNVRNWLRILATMQPPSTNWQRPETVEFAWNHFLRYDGISAKDRVTAFAGLIEARVVLGMTPEAGQSAAAALADEELPVATRLMAELVRLGLDATAAGTAVQSTQVEAAKTSLQAEALDLYHALNGAAAALKTLDEGRIARGYAGQAEQLVARPKPRYLCRYVEQAPLGAAGWFASELLADPLYREARFLDYSQKDADALILDVNAEREVGAKEQDKAAYFEQTAFYMVYDKAGWHIFVLCGEPNLAARQANGESLGALEMYMAPTPDSPYYQWIVGLDDGETSTYDWSSPHAGFRSAKEYLQAETRILGDRIGVYLFFPWEMLYDKLPFGVESGWLFETIRWSPAGGLSWSGGRVHNTGKWGSIEWEAPPDDALSQLRLGLLRKGWQKYRKASKELVDNYWRSRDFGDPEFVSTRLDPALERFDQAGALLQQPEGLSDAEITRLASEMLPVWHSFEYWLAAERRDYLEQRLTAAEGDGR